MVVFFDTSVLVAASSSSHPHFAQASAAVRRVLDGKDKGFVSQHSIAEVFSALTVMPVIPRIHPMEAAAIIRDNILKNFETVALDKDDYLSAMMIVSESGWPGGKIYDALLLCSAAKTSAQRIYTFNLKDFKLLAPSRMQHLICAP
jgi:predicted nucleic acid-binding protein